MKKTNELTSVNFYKNPIISFLTYFPLISGICLFMFMGILLKVTILTFYVVLFIILIVVICSMIYSFYDWNSKMFLSSNGIKCKIAGRNYFCDWNDIIKIDIGYQAYRPGRTLYEIFTAEMGCKYLIITGNSKKCKIVFYSQKIREYFCRFCPDEILQELKEKGSFNKNHY